MVNQLTAAAAADKKMGPTCSFYHCNSLHAFESSSAIYSDEVSPPKLLCVVSK